MRTTGVLVLLAVTAFAAPDSIDLTVSDTRTSDRRRACHDITGLRIRMKNGECIVAVTMAKPFVESMFLDAHIEFDTDDKASTGFEGFDFGVHAFLGSRFRRNGHSARDKGGRDVAQNKKKPLDRRGTVVKWNNKKLKQNSGFIHSMRESLAPPRIGERTLEFRFPMSLLRKYGLLYNNTVRWRFFVESGISEHPISTEYICSDDGIKIKLDGNAGEWPPLGVQVDDREGDLHPDAAEVDITKLQVEHDAKAVYALVRLARRGFGMAQNQGDVIDRDKIVVFLEPVGTRAYMKSLEAIAFTTHPTYGRRGTRYVTGSGLVEFEFKRKPEQGKFRVIAYADATRVDRVPNSGSQSITIPTKAWHKENRPENIK